jgi:L,D-peptidoglycan transpeptidase YkuD (ErfK/YbiS/YcfS/YnhG family)
MTRYLLLAGAALLAGCHTATPVPVQTDAFHNATQLVVVTTPDWDSISGQLRRFVRADAHSQWHADGAATPIVVGKTGLAWGVGLDERAEAAEPHKHEGDGRSPAGIFPVEEAFGFSAADSVPWVHMPYVRLTPTVECVDDTASVHYNAVVDRSKVSRVDWKSSEHMQRVGQYRLGAVIGYNDSPAVKGRLLHLLPHLGRSTHSNGRMHCNGSRRAVAPRRMARSQGQAGRGSAAGCRLRAYGGCMGAAVPFGIQLGMNSSRPPCPSTAARSTSSCKH